MTNLHFPYLPKLSCDLAATGACHDQHMLSKYHLGWTEGYMVDVWPSSSASSPSLYDPIDLLVAHRACWPKRVPGEFKPLVTRTVKAQEQDQTLIWRTSAQGEDRHIPSDVTL